MANTEDVGYGKKDRDCSIRSEAPNYRRESRHGERSTTMALSASTCQVVGKRGGSHTGVLLSNALKLIVVRRPSV